MLPSIDESIGRLRGEILSQDWRITPARAEALAAALSVLHAHFAARRAKAALGILAMAQSVLGYIRKQGDMKIPETVDFLKEAMAHLVFFHEEPATDPAGEKETFRAVFSRFQALKKRVGKIRVAATATATAVVAPETDVQSQIADLLEKQQAAGGDKTPANDPHFETLVQDLKDSLNKAEEVGLTIRHLLSGLSSTGHPEIAPAATALLKKNFTPTPPPASAPLPDLPPLPRVGHNPGGEASPCPVAPILPVEIAGRTIAIEHDLIIGRRDIAPSKKKNYINSGSVPLADFKKFMESLKSQFGGVLARVSNSKLKKLNLPVLTPRGIGLSERIDARVDTMLVLASGHWNGILLCSSPGKTEQMTHFQQAANGDIAGIAHTENNRYFLLDGAELLKREGFLVVP